MVLEQPQGAALVESDGTGVFETGGHHFDQVPLCVIGADRDNPMGEVVWDLAWELSQRSGSQAQECSQCTTSATLPGG